MLDTFRKHSNSSLIYLIFGALIFVFAVSFGPGSQGCKTGQSLNGSAEFAARVNSETISIRDFQRTYSQIFARYQQQGGGSFNEDLADQLGLKKMVLEHLVDRDLLAQAAAAHGLAVGDEELAREIQKIAAFQQNGVFSAEQYRLWVEREMGSTIPAFERELRKDLLSEKMRTLIEDSATATDEEVKASYTKDNDKADLLFVRFSPSQMVGDVKSNASAAEVDQYATVHAAEVSAFYSRNTLRYHKPQRLEGRRILIKLTPQATPANDAEAKTKIDKVAADLKAGKDFAELAKAESEDTSTKENGGQILIGPTTLDKPLDEAARKLKEGELTAPVRTRFGYEIVKVEKVLPAEDQSLDQAKHEIAEELMKMDQAKSVAKGRADEAEKQLLAGAHLEDLFPPSDPKAAFDFGSAQKLSAQDTGPFSAGTEFVPRLGPVPGIAAAAFNLTAEKPAGPKVFEVNDSYVVIQLKDRQKPDEQDFQARKEEIRDDLLKTRKQSLVGEYTKELRTSAKVEENQALTLPSKARPPSNPEEGA